MMRRARFASAAFTLVELMIVVAVVAIIAALAAPSFRDMILMQRLRGINAQVVTDIAFARSEAVSRGSFIQLSYQTTASMSCYVIYTRSDANPSPVCDCTQPAGSSCAGVAGLGEVRTVQIANADAVIVSTITNGPQLFTYDPRTGGIIVPPFDATGILPGTFVVESHIDVARKLRNIVGRSGRVTVCTPALSNVGGLAC